MSPWLSVLILACAPDEPATPAVAATPSVLAQVAEPEPPADVDPKARGVEVFAAHCASCHGPDGRGDGPAAVSLDPAPPDLRAKPRVAHLRGIPRRQIIEVGRPGTAMVGFKGVLSDGDLEAVYGFVHDMHHGPGGRPGMGGGRKGPGNQACDPPCNSPGTP